MSTWFVTGLLSVTLLFRNLQSIDVAESYTGALLHFPSVIDGPLFNKSYLVAPAQFGYQKYGGSLEGVLILPANTSYHKECPPYACRDCGQEPLETNPYIHYIKDWFISPDDVRDYILVIDRLDCYFIDKIEWAQAMGASGVIMCDWKYENLFTMWMPQDWNDDINIPSVLLQRSNCQTLMAHLGVKNWDPQHIQNTIYPDPENINWTIATIEWGLPHPDDRVEYELWTSSNDYLGSEFKHNFNTTAIMLDKANDTIFTPHMYILNGSHWGCPSPHLPCKKQCTNSGRYCAVDPEYDLSIGLDGMDVIQENLRSLCVWEYDKAQKGIMDDVMWWDYAVLWDENCGVYSNSSLNFHVNCSFAQMDKLDTSGALSTYVANCIKNSGGYDYNGGVNTILRAETRLKYNSSIYAVPMVRVNSFLIHGNIDCPPPVTSATCEVLAAICAGFIEGKPMPDACLLTPAPTILTCTDSEKDCNGTCFGSHLTDACGKCLLVSSHEWNECIGCNGQINGTYDCEGTCGGHYAVNTCGYCKDTRHPGWDTFGIDCKGGCNTNLKWDRCGQCINESDAKWNDCVDCENVANGGKEINECGFCLDPNDVNLNFTNYGKDCRGVCEGGYTLDKCGKCLSTDDNTRNTCVGCDGIVGSGKEFNQCDRCVNKTDPDFNEIGKDCSGECNGNHQTDDCGQCLLSTDSEFNNCCGGDINKRLNECGLCLYKNLTDFNERGRDCNGTCSGSHEIDGCGHCLLPTDPTYNDCIKCGDDKVYDCNDVCGGNHKVNPCGRCIDGDLPNFDTYGQDCLGQCNQTHSVDRCGKCLSTSSPERDACVGCDNVPNSNTALNPCRICMLKTRSDFETYGKDCSGECNGNHKMDDCGNCLLPSDKEWNSCTGCDGVANSGKEYNDCGVCVSSTDSNFNEHGRDCTGNCVQTIADTHYVDECGHCLKLGDDSWNSCIVNNNNGSNSNTAGDNNKGNNNNDNMTLWIIIVGLGAFLLICLAFVVIVYLCQKHNEMKRQFDEIRQNYQPMDDMGHLTQTTKSKKAKKEGTTRGGMTTIPDQEESD